MLEHSNATLRSHSACLLYTSDNMPSDGAQLKIMLDNLNLQEEAMTEMFSGTRDKEEKTFTVRLTPDKEFDNEVAFRFSKKLGVVANNDLAGTPFYISLKDLKTVKIPQELSLIHISAGVASSVRYLQYPLRSPPYVRQCLRSVRSLPL